MLTRSRLLIMTAALAFAAQPALAGPPLVCFPFEIGSARSLPVGTGAWHAIDSRYDASHVVDDTLALLTPETPIVVRMETLRRATLYVRHDAALAATLLDRLRQRASRPSAEVALAVFDFGYLVETYKQATLFSDVKIRKPEVDGYSLVAKSAAMHADPAIEFALAVMTRGNSTTSGAYRMHLARAREAASKDAAIAVNIARQFAGERF